jgi:hypothetical protein
LSFFELRSAWDIEKNARFRRAQGG